MIGIVTANMAESIRFYGLLGVDVPEYQPGEPYLEATLTGGIRLSWNDVEMVKSIDPEWTSPVGKPIELAFLCEGGEDVDQTFAKLISAGFVCHKEPWDAFWGQRYAVVIDPDGNEVSLFAPL